jgi:periplasmic divalent cation tolerance protein
MPMEMIYFTAASRDDALRIGRILVEYRLAACINILGDITSIYRWDGAIQEGTEVAAIAKTSSEKVSEVIERIKAIHPYSCPCAISWPIATGNPDFLEWIDEETRS